MVKVMSLELLSKYVWLELGMFFRQYYWNVSAKYQINVFLNWCKWTGSQLWFEICKNIRWFQLIKRHYLHRFHRFGYSYSAFSVLVFSPGYATFLILTGLLETFFLDNVLCFTGSNQIGFFGLDEASVCILTLNVLLAF